MGDRRAHTGVAGPELGTDGWGLVCIGVWAYTHFIQKVLGYVPLDELGLCPEWNLLLLPPLQVPEIIQYIYHNVNNITETTAQGTIEKILYLLAQTYTDEVILTLFKMEDQSQR